MASKAMTQKKKKKRKKTDVSAMVNWLLHCFKCGNKKPRNVGSRSSKNHTEGDGAELGVGNSYEDLYKVRGSHGHFKSLEAVCDTLCEEELDGHLFPSLSNASQGKSEEQSRNKTVHVNATESEEKRINHKPWDLRKRTFLLLDATEISTIEARYQKACNSVIHKTSGTGADYSQDFVSPQNSAGILVESSTPSSRCQSYSKEYSREIKTMSDFKQATLQCGSSNDGIPEDGKVNSFNIECVVYDELSNEVDKWTDPMEMLEAASQGHFPPWTSSYKNSEGCEDLLLDHMDISCLIEDSTLISNWEKSFNTLSSGKEDRIDGSIKELALQESKKALETIDSVTFSQPQMRKVGTSSANEFEFEHDMITLNLCTSHECDGDVIDNRGRILERGSHNKALSERWICMDMEKMDNFAISQDCFSPHINVLTRLWSKLKRVTPEQVLVETSTSDNNHNFHESLPLPKRSFDREENLSSVSSCQLWLVECNNEATSNVVNCQLPQFQTSNEGWVHDCFLESPRIVEYVDVPSLCLLEKGSIGLPKKMYDTKVSEAFCHELEHDDHDHEDENDFVEAANASVEVLDVDAESNGIRVKEKNNKGCFIQESSCFGDLLDYVDVEFNRTSVNLENEKESCSIEEVMCFSGKASDSGHVDSYESPIKHENDDKCSTQEEVSCLEEVFVYVYVASNESSIKQDKENKKGFIEVADVSEEALDYGCVESDECLFKQENVILKEGEKTENVDVIEIGNENENKIEKQKVNEEKLECANENMSKDKNKNMIEFGIENGFSEEANDFRGRQSSESKVEEEEALARNMIEFGIESSFSEEANDFGECQSRESIVEQEEALARNMIEFGIENGFFEEANDFRECQFSESIVEQEEALARDIHSICGDDRPILGTVAAHWSPISIPTSSKWWDGKGIPNSTYKYKEDQKVSWHSMSFEERLEKALARQDSV